ncbi:MAG TPA: hypothetical protein PKY77_17985 [Phycisphaerae bacterium]|nr:hypothetical protein [Phycisphaerae bacterium]HRY70257.1 hypothetical protein [Phycisphaerae bacterium]HSA27572.1 hypothetical protein [Phycisphaerae bacterium]
MGDSQHSGPRNVHGRRWGRGFRPYLIVAKLLCVAAYVGGLMALLVVVFQAGLPGDAEGWRQVGRTVHRAYAWLIVPGFLGATVVGVLLTASMVGPMARMRWFRLKLLLLAVGAPSLHVYLRGRSIAFQSLLVAAQDVSGMVAVFRQLLAGTVVGLFLGVALLVLGRVKPRLGQAYGSSVRRT